MEPNKQDILHQKTKKKTKGSRRGTFAIPSIPYPPDGQPTNWKTIISQIYSHRSKNSDPHIRLPSLGGWHQEERPPEHLALKASMA